MPTKDATGTGADATTSPTRVALVTGAPRGIGAAVADTGLHVLVSYIEGQTHTRRRRVNPTRGERAATAGADISDHASVEQLIAAIGRRFGLPGWLADCRSSTQQPNLSTTAWFKEPPRT